MTYQHIMLHYSFEMFKNGIVQTLCSQQRHIVNVLLRIGHVRQVLA